MNIPFGHERDNQAMRSAGLPLLLLAALSIGPAQGQWLRWPRQSASPINAATPDAPAAAVRLRFARQGAMREVWADNDLSGPVEVRIDSARGHPGFPLQRALPGRGEYLLARLPADIPLSLRLAAVPGPSGAQPEGVVYRYPLLRPRIRIGQAPEGEFSHADDENRYAIDFAAPIGTPVIAARAGTVMQVEDRFGDQPGLLDEANFVRVLHPDGSMAVYAHLQRGSLQVMPGQRVEADQLLAHSGNSGYSSGPHLHFAVQVNRGMRLVSIPVRIESASGELRLPRSRAQP